MFRYLYFSPPSGKATGRRAKLGKHRSAPTGKANGRVSGNLGIVGYCLPPSHLGYSSILDSTRFGVGSSKLDSTLAAPIIDGASIQKKSCKPNAASLLIAEAQPIFMGEAHNVRATSRF